MSEVVEIAELGLILRRTVILINGSDNVLGGERAGAAIGAFNRA